MKIFYILFFITMASISARSQVRITAQADAVPRVIKFFPNPATSQITFNFNAESDKNLSFEIYNFIGKKVYETQSVSPSTLVNISDFYRGLYIFQLKDRSGKIVDSGKFQKVN